MIHAGGIGDFILTTPAIAAFSADWRIELVGAIPRLDLVLEAGIVEVICSNAHAGMDSLYSEPNAAARDCFGGADKVVALLRDPEGQMARAMCEIGVGEFAAIPGLPPQDYAKHASQYYWEALGLEGEAPPPRLALPVVKAGWDVLVHPGSGSLSKNWPMERFEVVAQVLEARGRSVTWLAGPAEIERGIAPLGAVAVESLVELGGKLAGARVYIGNDSGITHLAAAVGCPVVAVFGPTDPAVWGPRGEHVRVVSGQPWPDVEAVVEAAVSLPFGRVS
jgi:ADP-heptose:LPS heptosyltransferase